MTCRTVGQRRLLLPLLFVILAPLIVSCAEKIAPAPIARPESVASPQFDLDLKNRLAFPASGIISPSAATEPLYSLRVKNMDVARVLALFARAYKLNIITDADIEGKVSVNFHGLSFKQAMDAILGSLDYAWEREGNLIRVHAWETRNFTVNYIRLVRSTSGSSQASASSGGDTSSGGGSSSGGSGQSGSITISQQDTVKFWGELDKQLSTLVSKEGKLVINRIAGVIQVTDHPSHVRNVRKFLTRLNRSINRQVQIDVKIVEVTLNDDYRLGIDWNRIDIGSLATKVTFSTSNAIATPAGGFLALPKSLSLNIGHQSNRGKGDINSVIEALSEQGNVKIISQPKVRTLNNQPAMIKVGVDKTFFRKEQSTTTGTATTTASTDVPQVVTEGIVLAITPQISADGWIMMDISPVITRVSSVTEVKDAAGTVQSSAPNLEIRQASSLVRARDDSTIILGGLIQDTISKTDRGVPFLEDLPLLGPFFKGVSRIKKKTELVIFITPHLVGRYAPEGGGGAAP